MYLETATLCIEIYFCYWGGGVSGFIFILKIYLDDSLELGIITCQCFTAAVGLL